MQGAVWCWCTRVRSRSAFISAVSLQTFSKPPCEKTITCGGLLTVGMCTRVRTFIPGRTRTLTSSSQKCSPSSLRTNRQTTRRPEVFPLCRYQRVGNQNTGPSSILFVWMLEDFSVGQDGVKKRTQQDTKPSLTHHEIHVEARHVHKWQRACVHCLRLPPRL